MAETLETSELLMNDFEPMRKFQWVVEIDGIDAYTAKSFAKPNQSREHITIDFVNQKRFLAGKGEWQTLTLTLLDPIDGSASQKIWDWMRLVHDEANGRMGYATMYKKTFSLKQLDGPGNVVQKWRLVGAWIQNPNFGDLDYASSDAVEITLELRFDRAILEY